MKKNLALFLFFFITFQVCASSLSGTWSGLGVSQTAQSYRECSEVFFRFEETASQLKILNGGYVCRDLQAEYPFSVFEKKNGDLLYKGEVVGGIAEKSFFLDVPEEFYRLQVELVDGQLRTQEIWDDSQSFLKVYGMLEKLN
jgi:hypothetical protein